VLGSRERGSETIYNMGNNRLTNPVPKNKRGGKKKVRMGLGAGTVLISFSRSTCRSKSMKLAHQQVSRQGERKQEWGTTPVSFSLLQATKRNPWGFYRNKKRRIRELRRREEGSYVEDWDGMDRSFMHCSKKRSGFVVGDVGDWQNFRNEEDGHHYMTQSKKR